jgi:hypothetical protein
MRHIKNYFALTLNELTTAERIGLDQAHIIIKDVNDRRSFHNWKTKLDINFVTRTDQYGIIRGWKLNNTKQRKARVKAVIMTPPTLNQTPKTWINICSTAGKAHISKGQFADYIFGTHFTKGSTIDMTTTNYYRNNKWLQDASRRYKVRLNPVQVDSDTVRYTVS